MKKNLLNENIKMKENEDNNYTNFDIDESKMKPQITNQQLKQIKQNHDMQIEESFNQLNMQTKQIKEGQKMMKNILKNQEPLLETVNEDMDRVDNKMKMENNKLKLYLEKSSTTCLYWIIGIELLILFLLFLTVFYFRTPNYIIFFRKQKKLQFSRNRICQFLDLHQV